MDVNTSTPAGSIVVGVDGSDASRQALQWAADQAALEGRPLFLVHVADPFGGSEGPDARTVLDEAAEVVEWREPDVEVHASSQPGNAREILLEHAERASLLVVGSRGRGRARSVLFGSVGVGVGTRAACPVVVVRPHHPGVPRRGALVGVDTTAASRAPLEFGYQMASMHALPLTVLHCVPDDVPDDVEEHERELAELVAGMTEKFPDVHVKRRLTRLPVSEGVLDQAVDMDLVVVGRHHRAHRHGRGIGTLAATVIEHGACAVAVVPTAG
jgi:nucleotide-binding universal stress UspA family protein